MLSFILIALSPALAQVTADFDSCPGSVQFLATGKPGAIKIVGKGSAPKGKLSLDQDKISGAVTFDLGSLDTNISMRNEHMKKKYLETEKYPQARLTLTKIDLSEDAMKGDLKRENVAFEGVLNLHGVDKQVKGTCDIAKSGAKTELKAKFETAIAEFNMPIPSFAGITVADKVEITVETEPAMSASASAKK